ncbi:hypothetical protein, partial [Aeromonas caviae]|uniref:hypothetical protein n=1 Tax=Aeromonas caviae TaxID=648 RepID=UPI001CC39766
HIHIVASRVGLDGKVWLGQWEARRAIEATQELEHTHGVLVWSKPMRCMKSAVTASHFSALRRSPGGSDSEQ